MTVFWPKAYESDGASSSPHPPFPFFVLMKPVKCKDSFWKKNCQNDSTDGRIGVSIWGVGIK